MALDTLEQPAAVDPPTSAELSGRFAAVEMINGWQYDRDAGEVLTAADIEWVIVEVPARIGKNRAMEYACTRAIATDPKYQEWKLGSIHWIENGLRLVPEQEHGLFD